MTVLLCLLYSTLSPSHMDHKPTNISYTPFSEVCTSPLSVFGNYGMNTTKVNTPLQFITFYKRVSYFALHSSDKNAVHPCYTNSATSPTHICGGEVYVTFEGANASERLIQRSCGRTLHFIFLFTFNLTST